MLPETSFKQVVRLEGSTTNPEVVMLAFFSIVPMGEGLSLGPQVAEAIKIVEDSGRIGGKVASVETALGHEVRK